MTERKHVVQRHNHQLSHFTGRWHGEYYRHGEVQKKKDTLTRKTITLTPGKAVVLKFGK